MKLLTFTCPNCAGNRLVSVTTTRDWIYTVMTDNGPGIAYHLPKTKTVYDYVECYQCGWGQDYTLQYMFDKEILTEEGNP